MEPTRTRRRPYSSLKMIEKRQTGKMFSKDFLTSRYYKHMNLKTSQDEAHGSIFNLEFSPSGKLMVAACENSTILIFDPNSRNCLHKLVNAHEDSVNCICFCDERIFASGSDDCAIMLWDARMLREQVMRLPGHTNWVKSLAHDRNSGLLVSSSFDGTVRTWNINSSEHTSDTILKNKDKVSRMELSSLGDKLIVSCGAHDESGDNILIFHNLDLQTFEKDFVRARKLSSRNICECLDSSDYPALPLCIPSLQVHPQSSCLVSRYITHNRLQYTAVHSLQDFSHGTSVVKNNSSLTHYIEESDSAGGIIKELSFSHDGRVIASPFAHGTRLLAFGPDCNDWHKSSRQGDAPAILTEIRFLLSHSMPVCCSEFSPIHMMVATGCLGGKIAFHEPKL